MPAQDISLHDEPWGISAIFEYDSICCEHKCLQSHHLLVEAAQLPLNVAFDTVDSYSVIYVCFLWLRIALHCD